MYPAIAPFEPASWRYPTATRNAAPAHGPKRALGGALAIDGNVAPGVRCAYTGRGVECPPDEVVPRLLADELSVDRRQAIASHASCCAPCRDLLGCWLDASTGDAERVGRYEIERKLGQGATGVVYAAHDRALGRHVALKLLRPGARADRLRREAQLLAQLEHPNVVAVYDVGEHDGQQFIAMALVDGEDLRRWAARPRQLDEILGVVCAAGRGVAAAHARGLVHRDLKPDNIFVARDGRTLVGDFGLARFAAELEPMPWRGERPAPTALTATGSVLGTPLYMAPEQAAGAPCPASDQFSLCVTAWELVYGVLPFTGDDLAALTAAICRGPARPPTDRRVPRRIERALRRGLRPDPAARFPDVAALVAALGPRTRRARAAASVGALALAVAVASVVRTSDGAASSASGCGGIVDALDLGWLGWPAERARLQAALPVGPAAPRLLDALERQARDLHTARLGLCAPRASAAEAAPTRACLERLDHRLAALVAVARQATSQPLELWAAAEQLPSIDSCQHEPPLAPLGPLTRVVPRAVLNGELRRAEVLALVDQSIAPLAARALADRARALDDPDAGIAATVLEARAWLDRSELVDAERVARAAIALAELRGADRARASASAVLAHAVARLARAREAEGLVDAASTALARVGRDRETARQVAVARIEALLSASEAQAALTAQRDLIDALRGAHGEDSPLVARAYEHLESMLAARGELARAVDASQIAGAFFARYEVGGPAEVMARGHAARDRGELARGAELLDELVARLRAERVAPAQLVPALLDAAQGHVLAAQFADAARRYANVLDLLDALPLDVRDAHQVNAAWFGLGQARWAAGELARSIEPLGAARTGAVALHHGGRTAVITVLVGDALERIGRAREAVATLEPVAWPTAELAIHDRGRGEFALARALWTIGGARDRERAADLADDAVRDYEAGVARLSPQLVDAATRGIAERELAELRAWRASHVMRR